MFGADLPLSTPRDRSRELNPREHLIESGQLGIGHIEAILRRADCFRRTPHYRAGALRGKRCILYFTQSSTRTYMSFSLAAQRLGFAVADVRDLTQTAAVKGESEQDALLTLASNADVLVVRDGGAQTARQVATMIAESRLGCRVISAGSGSVEHPTQALCDLYVASKSYPLRSRRRRKAVFIGDVRRGRAALSFARVLSNWSNWEQYFLSPGDLAVEQEFCLHLNVRGVTTMVLTSFSEIPADVDLIYLMRNQQEYGGSTTTVEQYHEMVLTPERLLRFTRRPIVLHPLPRGEEAPALLDKLPNAKFWEVVQQSQNVRCAILSWMFGL